VVEQKHSKPGKGLTWWWNDDVESAVKEKRKLWKVWKKGERRAKHEVYTRLKNLLPKQVLVIFMKKKN